MNDGGTQGSNDEDDDIYKDIGDFQFDRELAKLEESNKTYIEDIATLNKKLNELEEKNEALQGVNEILATNISILLKTAKAEIARKQLEIEELRKKVEFLSRRQGGNERNNFQRTVSLSKCSNEPIKDSCHKSDVEEGEIVQDDSEGMNCNSELRRADDSNMRDRGYHSDGQRRRHNSHEKGKERSWDTSSRNQKSKYVDNGYLHHFTSSRSHRQSISPGTRNYDSRPRSRERSSHSSRSSHRSRNRKTESFSQRKEESSRKSRERQRSDSRRDFERPKKNSSIGHGGEKKVNKPESKSREVKSDRKKNKELENTEKCNAAKTISMAEYRLRKSGENNSQKKNDLDVVFKRQSILADLYKEPAVSETFPEILNDVLDKNSAAEPQIDVGGDSDWTDTNVESQWNKNEIEPSKKPKTLYSKRMEAKFQQQQQLKDEIIPENSEDSAKKQENDEKFDNSGQNSEKTAEINIDVKKNSESDAQLGKEEVKDTNSSSEVAEDIVSDSIQQSPPKLTEVNLENSLDESLMKKFLQSQVGINEFSPLKNNYKLSKISPLKPVSKQHILEYYNLKPSPQQLTNIEPEVLDFSFSLPETPGKNFLSCFLPLNDNKDSSNSKENDSSDDKLIASSPKKETPRVTRDSKSGGESGIEDLNVDTKPNRTKKRSCKVVKGSEMSSESKKCVQTSDEEEQGKSCTTRYQIRTRSKADSDNNEGEVVDDKKMGSKEEGGVKRERRPTSSDEGDSSAPPKRMKCETLKTENDTSIEVIAEGTVPDDITSFEVFKAVTDETATDMDTLLVEEKNVTWNGDDYPGNKTASNEDYTADKGKPLLSSTGNSEDSSNFKGFRSYRMLLENEESDDLDNSSSGSGEYSDSGASALVDLL